MDDMAMHRIGAKFSITKDKGLKRKHGKRETSYSVKDVSERREKQMHLPQRNSKSSPGEDTCLSIKLGGNSQYIQLESHLLPSTSQHFGKRLPRAPPVHAQIR